jgi:hypothetical protein
MMYNPTDTLKFPITEWHPLLASDTAVECENYIAERWKRAEKEHDEFKHERYMCVPADVVYPQTQPQK